MSNHTIKKLSIIIPVFNEDKTVGLMLDKIKRLTLINNIQKEIIVVNDGSHDDTEACILTYQSGNPEMDIKYFKHHTNQGKGKALHTGIQEITGEALVIQDADLEYNPEDFNSMLDFLLNGNVDVIYGSRFKNKKNESAFFSWHYAGNKLLTFLSNWFNNQHLTDMETCYKMFKTPIIKQLTLHEKRFGFEPEVTAKIASIPHIKIKEVGISYNRRNFSEGKKIGLRDGFRAVYCIFKYGLFSR